MAKKKKPKKHSVAQMTQAVKKAKPGFKVTRVKSEGKSKRLAAGDARRTNRANQAIATPDLMTLRQKYGLSGAGDVVPNGSSAGEPKTENDVNEVFQIQPKSAGSSDKPAPSKVVIVSKYTNKPVSAQG